MRKSLSLILILLCGVFIYGYRLGDSPLDRTEPFRALVAHQMVTGGNWLIPRLYGEVYLRKPPLIYWIEAGTEKLMGHGNEFVWRLPSAIGSALLAVFIAWWSSRWFGARALLPSGFACLALVALWDQNRGADIDALNTVFAVITSLCALELAAGLNRRRAAWSIGLGLSLGATLLLKGPGGLPQVIGAIVGPAIFLRNWKRVRSPAIAIGLLIGFALFTAYVITAKFQMQRAGITPDHTGWYEVIEKIFLHGWGKRVLALLMPAELLIFALPVSAVLPFAIALSRRTPTENPQHPRAVAILGTLAATVAIWMFEGNDNPRYEYVMLPLLSPLVGFVWTGWDLKDRRLGLALTGISLLVCGANSLIVIKGLHVGMDHLLMMLLEIGSSVILLLGLCVTILRKTPSRSLRYSEEPDRAAKTPSLRRTSETVMPGAISVLLILLFALPMAERKNAERRRKSSKGPAAVLRQVIGDSKRVSAAGVVRDLPELFYYANVDVDSYGEFGLPQLAATRGGHWVVISENEKYPAYSTITKFIPHAFPRGVTRLPMPDPRDQIYVGWYDPPANADTRIDWHVEKQTEADE